MKKLAALASFVCVLFVVGISSAATAPVEVTAKDKASGKVVYKGKTGDKGQFATGTLSAGSYVFEFVSQDGSGFQVALAGAKSAKQTKGPKSGLAFVVEVAAPSSKVSGKITPVAATAVASAKSNAKVKVINGKRYVWVRGEIGSNMGGKWIPEDEAEKVDPTGSRRSATEGLRSMQDIGGQGAVPGN